MVIVLLTPTNIAPTSAAAARAAHAAAPFAAFGLGFGNRGNRCYGYEYGKEAASGWGLVHLMASRIFSISRGLRPTPDLKAPG